MSGIPVVSGLVLSGAQTVVVKLSDYVVSHPIPSKEGGSTERVGSKADRIEIHGIFYASGADIRLAQLSGFIGKVVAVKLPSFQSGFKFYPLLPPSGIGVVDVVGGNVFFESLKYQPEAGYGYPFYRWVLKGVEASGFVFTYQQLSGITYTQDLGTLATLFADYSQNMGQQAVLFSDYAQNLGTLATLFIGYTQNLGQSVTLFTGYSQNLGQLATLSVGYVGSVSGNHLSGGNGY